MTTRPMLDWQTSAPKPDPFEVVARDTTVYQVHFAECRALELREVEYALSEIVTKALEFTAANAGARCHRLVFLWDVVYSTLTVVYTDQSMMLDARHVTRCHFTEIDKAGVDQALTDRVRTFLDFEISRQRPGRLPLSTPVYFSDEDRASVGADAFTAQQIALCS